MDLLITDVGLPNGIDGARVAEPMRQSHPGVPVLFVTGYAGNRLPPGTEVIFKPFALDFLTRRVERLLADRAAPPARDLAG